MSPIKNAQGQTALALAGGRGGIFPLPEPQKAIDPGITPSVIPASRPSQQRKRGTPTLTSSMIPDFASGSSRGKTLLGQ